MILELFGGSGLRVAFSFCFVESSFRCGARLRFFFPRRCPLLCITGDAFPAGLSLIQSLVMPEQEADWSLLASSTFFLFFSTDSSV